MRLAIVTGAGIRELFIQDTAQPHVLLFILVGLGVPEALRALSHGGKS